MLLAIDTSTRTAGIALLDNGAVLAEMTWQSAQNHSRELMPNISLLINQAKAAFSDLNGIVIARGPGSFSALRVGMSVAKGLAFSLSVPIIGISTLEAMAYQQVAANAQLCPVLEIGRGEVAAAIFRKSRGKLKAICAEQIFTVDSLAETIDRRTIFCGEIANPFIEAIEGKLAKKAVFLPPVASYRRAGFVADLGWRRLQLGEQDALETLQPAYLRRPSVGGQSK